MTRETRNAFIASAVIMLAIAGGLLLMPTIMNQVAGFGPAGGVVIAVAFVAALFVVLWLRGRYQRRHRGDNAD